MNYHVAIKNCAPGEVATLSAGNYYRFVLILDGCAAVAGVEGSPRCDSDTLLYVGVRQTAVLRSVPENRGLRFMRLDLSEPLLEELSDAETDLVAWFQAVGPVCRVLKPDCALLGLVKNLTLNLEHLPQDPPTMGVSVYERGLLSLLAVLLARACRFGQGGKSGRSKGAFAPDAVLGFIARHITEEITLERLEAQFFISRSYISREFKKATGQTVHRYILRAKLELCRQYIAQGMPVTEVCKRVEIGGYNNFFRAFRKEYGMTPGEYCAKVHRKTE